MTFNRRTLLGAGLAAAALPLMQAKAAAPFVGRGAPAWYRFRFGEYEATVISDGALPLGKAEDSFVGARPGEINAMMQANFLDPANALLEQNALVLNTGRNLILFDTGMGDSMGADSQMFGPTTGRLLRNMRQAGIDPAQIDLVVLSHAHCDHCWALVDAQGNRNFPNAQVAVSEADLKYWTDEGNIRGPAFMGPFIRGATKNLNAYRDRMVMVQDGREVVPGVIAMSAPGHTVGHTIYAINSGPNVMVYTGDLAHHQVLLLRRPLLEFSFDTDPKQSAQTRARALERFANERVQLLSYHFPWPGLGRVAKEGEGYAWMPSAMDVTSLG
ncbi:MBL fold metallo-hydrolase [Neoroseomonas oryzicola]|uniref:MBL fold metallo-hydrolase n=1 Tax=Neoroseomonas oryzicola TaxID=535904 RepID=A0A9X9WLC7_9PROT|nr:MBL fold metallo-hydrolase [Neoroseomonas oryzicola]MBR0661137.1 MBL fold metallo-hydrolase [Neoroseomonas oryzicola]NKE15882.1 MBL fold metallo-hydrolase [Neoroseomonas oryzicola]